MKWLFVVWGLLQGTLAAEPESTLSKSHAQPNLCRLMRLVP